MTEMSTYRGVQALMFQKTSGVQVTLASDIQIVVNCYIPTVFTTNGLYSI